MLYLGLVLAMLTTFTIGAAFGYRLKQALDERRARKLERQGHEGR